MSLSSLIRTALAIQQVWKRGESLHVDIALGHRVEVEER